MKHDKILFKAKVRKKPVKKRQRTYADVAKDRITFSVIRFFSRRTDREVVAGTEEDNKEGRPVAKSTVRNLRRPVRDSGTGSPRAHTLARLLEAHGASLEVVKDGKVWK